MKKTITITSDELTEAHFKAINKVIEGIKLEGMEVAKQTMFGFAVDIELTEALFGKSEETEEPKKTETDEPAVDKDEAVSRLIDKFVNDLDELMGDEDDE